MVKLYIKLCKCNIMLYVLPMGHITISRESVATEVVIAQKPNNLQITCQRYSICYYFWTQQQFILARNNTLSLLLSLWFHAKYFWISKKSEIRGSQTTQDAQNLICTATKGGTVLDWEIDNKLKVESSCLYHSFRFVLKPCHRISMFFVVGLG